MKILGVVAGLLLCSGLAAGFTSILRAGTNVAQAAMKQGSSLANAGLDTASSMGASNVPLLGTALSAAQQGTNMATSIGTTGLAMVDGAASMASLMSSIMSNPLVIKIIAMLTKLMVYVNSMMG